MRVSPESIEALVGFRPDDLTLYERALTHRSRFRGKPGAALGSYERMEFLGDALLGFVVAGHLYEALPEKAEGALTQLRARLVNGKALSKRARALDLGEYLLMSENAARKGRTNTSILADAYEAMVGAIYLDQNMEAARTFIRRTLLDEVDLEGLSDSNENFKSQLLEYVQARGEAQPSYRIAHAKGPSHDRTFTAEVTVEDEVRGRGTGPSKQAAEQRAAGEALTQLRDNIDARRE